VQIEVVNIGIFIEILRIESSLLKKCNQEEAHKLQVIFIHHLISAYFW